jgi:uncharacterized membrane protein SpoIIM required for sporulation
LREALFIKKNKDRWHETQHAPSADPDEMAVDFMQMVDDLGYAKTFYPHSKITDFLNSQSSKMYLEIYENRRSTDNRFKTFFLYKLPLAVQRHHKTLLVVFIIFVLFFAIGFVSARNNPTFVRQMLGDNYVDMTEENIKSGKPFEVYAGSNMFSMWIGIMINNIAVSLGYYFKGIVLGILPVYSMINEAIRIGAFEYMFFKNGYGVESILTVFIHGTLELSAIVIATAASVSLGTGWMFPGTRSRLEAFKNGAMDGALIIFGLMPVFVVAAFFEGYVTRHYMMPWYMSFPFLFFSLVFLIVYFVWWPIVAKKRMDKQKLMFDQLQQMIHEHKK